MKRSFRITVCLLGILAMFISFVGCVKQSAKLRQVAPGNKYAAGFQITETDSVVIVEIMEPYCRIEIREPMQRLGAMSTVQVGFLYAIDALDNLVAVCNPELIYTPLKGDEIDLGDSMKPIAERVLQSNLDALLTVNYGQYDNLEASRLEKLGVFTIYINEWQEGSPLARAEWIRVIGALTGHLHEADSVFHVVETRYNELVEAREMANNPAISIMSGNNFRGTWYVPSGMNYLAYLFKDAKANYPYYNDMSATSIPLTIEQTIRAFSDADVWVGAGGNSLDELAEMDSKHTWFKAYKNGRVYNWRKQQLPSGANNFWERGVVHPEEMLEDIINILDNAPDSLLHFALRLR